jgi:4-oxalocrotonate tautomerase
MPLVRIALPAGLSAAEKISISEDVHRALVETVNVPAQDKFQIITEHAPSDLVLAPEYLGIPHSAHAAIIQIFLNDGRTTALKQALYAQIAHSISQHTSIKANDVIINLVEVKKENWSFGNGVAQYAS